VGAAVVSKLQNSAVQKMCILGVSRLDTTDKYILVMDYADLGDLITFLRKNPDLSWSRKLQILLKLADSLRDFHATGMIHRDIHAGNVLIESRENNADLTDYGLSIRADEAEKYKEVFGVMPYVAPEVLSGKPYTQVFVMTFFCVVSYILYIYIIQTQFLQHCSSGSGYLCIWSHNVDV